MVPTRELAELVDGSRGLTASSCSSATTASCRRSRPAASSAACASARRSSSRTTSARRTRGSGEARSAARRRRRASASTSGTGPSRVGATRGAHRERMVDDWLAAGDLDRAVMIARQRADVAELNRRARAMMRAAESRRRELERPGPASPPVIGSSSSATTAGAASTTATAASSTASTRRGTLHVRFDDRTVVLDASFLASQHRTAARRSNTATPSPRTRHRDMDVSSRAGPRPGRRVPRVDLYDDDARVGGQPALRRRRAPARA